ncbi:MAG: ABC transporter ATP-binding protein [Desulfurococcaceae archaeon]
MEEEAILVINNVSKYFGGLKALNKVTIEIPEKCIVGLIGPNGSGKTTLFNVITGFYPPDEGKIMYKTLSGNFVDITGLNPHEVFKMGVIRTFQIPRLFPSLTVLENLLITPLNQRGESVVNSLRRSKWLREEEELVHRAVNLLKTFNRLDIASKYPSELSIGDIKLIETLRGLMTPARLYLLDEPLAGLDLHVARSLLRLIRELNKNHGLTFLIVEHRIDLLMEIADFVYVLHNGFLLASGTPSEIINDFKVVRAYIGE